MKTALNREHDGVAIAASQIGVPLRIFIVSGRTFTYEENPDQESAGGHLAPLVNTDYPDMIFINPEIAKLSRKKKWLQEGCLSVRWLYGEVPRATQATVNAYDENGKYFTRGASGLLAQIFQHEIDHLNGKLFTDTARNIETITQEEQERLRNQHEINRG